MLCTFVAFLLMQTLLKSTTKLQTATQNLVSVHLTGVILVVDVRRKRWLFPPAPPLTPSTYLWPRNVQSRNLPAFFFPLLFFFSSEAGSKL
jgi:hypothetical protein